MHGHAIRKGCPLAPREMWYRSLTTVVAQRAVAPQICTRRDGASENERGGGEEGMVEALADGGEAGLAHLSQSAATGSAAPRPKRSPHLICPILRGGREE